MYIPRLRAIGLFLLAFVLVPVLALLASSSGGIPGAAAKPLSVTGSTVFLPMVVHHNASFLPAGTRRVNAPFFNPTIWLGGAAIFWFGRITPTGNGWDGENYADVRVAYNPTELLLRVAIFDRRIWCNTDPAGSDMTRWDTVAISIDRNGNTGSAPSTGAFRFLSEFSDVWTCAGNLQAAYRGNGTGWASSGTNFTTESYYRGGAGPNVDGDNQGWVQTFHIPFASLGLSGPPRDGTIWGLGVNLYDRDSAAGAPIPVQVWPESMDSNRPSTWGQLYFGLPPAYVAAPATPRATVTIKNGVNGAVVTDGMVGGNMTCGQGLDEWTQWGAQNYARWDQVNIQNQEDVADWPCFSKYYITFPLSSLPGGKVIISSTLTLRLFGNAGMGWNPGPWPSVIQAFTVDQNWDENTLNWNNAPLAAYYVSSTTVNPLASTAPWPGIPYDWDVSAAVANAYASGRPLRLVLYSPDRPMHSGKYFYSSYASVEGRPSLQVLWGDP